MTFSQIAEEAKKAILVLQVQISIKEHELLQIKRAKEEQEGMLEDANLWLDS